MLTRMVSISWPCDPPASASQSAGITGVSHCAQHKIHHSNSPKRKKKKRPNRYRKITENSTSTHETANKLMDRNLPNMTKGIDEKTIQLAYLMVKDNAFKILRSRTRLGWPLSPLYCSGHCSQATKITRLQTKKDKIKLFQFVVYVDNLMS